VKKGKGRAGFTELLRLRAGRPGSTGWEGKRRREREKGGGMIKSSPAYHPNRHVRAGKREGGRERGKMPLNPILLPCTRILFHEGCQKSEKGKERKRKKEKRGGNQPPFPPRNIPSEPRLGSGFGRKKKIPKEKRKGRECSSTNPAPVFYFLSPCY